MCRARCALPAALRPHTLARYAQPGFQPARQRTIYSNAIPLVLSSRSPSYFVSTVLTFGAAQFPAPPASLLLVVLSVLLRLEESEPPPSPPNLQPKEAFPDRRSSTFEYTAAHPPTLDPTSGKWSVL